MLNLIKGVVMFIERIILIFDLHLKKVILKFLIFLLCSFFVSCFSYSITVAQIKKTLPNSENKIPSVSNAPSVFTLDNPIINEYFNSYVPVRFMHRKHANILQDCTVCHHRVLFDKEDKIIDKAQIKYGQKVSMEQLKKISMIPIKCSLCHNKPFKPEYPDILGLKGAYHQRCIGCHREAVQVFNKRGPIKYTAMVMGSSVHSMKSKAPTDCLGCHEKKVPDHSKLVKLDDNVTAKEVTAECLRCHEKAGKEIIDTSHWKWQGPSPYSAGNEKRIDLGKSGKIFNNFCININGNWSSCTGCHIGYGWKDESFDFNDMSNIDCLVCHDRTQWHEYVKTTAGWPAKDVNLKVVAENVGRPQRANCGMQCHFFGGHGGGTKHGALTPILDEIEEPSKYCDVHMGGENNFKCQDYHTTRNHKIVGRSIAVSVSEGDMSCAYCHTDKPHINTSLLSHHLNKHTDNIACQTCHIPIFSKSMSTEILWDWSAMEKTNKDLHHGKRVRVQAGQPTYMWYNGTSQNYVMGDPINENGPTNIAKPMGGFYDSSARIYPFKPHKCKQVYDVINILPTVTT